MVTETAVKNGSILAGLRRRWGATAVAWAAFLLLGYGLLRLVWPYAERWLFLSTLAAVYGLWALWRDLNTNHRRGEAALLPTLGWGNRLTLLRGLAISMAAGFLLSPWPQGWLAWAPVLLYTAADVADYIDGYLARVTDHATLLGEKLDMAFDGMGMLVVTLLAIWYGQLPVWYLGVGGARYLFLFGLWLRRQRGLPIYEITPSVHRRIFAGFQMGFMSVVLWPILPATGVTVAGTVFAIPTVLGFGRDWLAASGRLHTETAVYRKWQRRIVHLMRRRLPPLLRLIVAAGMTPILLRALSDFPSPAWTALLASWRFPAPSFFAGVVTVSAVVGTAGVALGAAGRLAAFMLLFPVGFSIIVFGLLWGNGLALAAVCSLMMLGTGRRSLWQPEERFMWQRAGEAPTDE